ncbi:hypothetical protein FD723_40460 (plasmid) [Nostoc sp. C052]|uniref:hypothetical protein n=1 Tax=Nostoc sp. C052 TaxID=2576902 RepID=UPI0015C354D7|nr:hypothetical protein [Nostoc sp. C052]QLE46487.1 hypothetical protein FD723_40460 [Nostoc sp. C052]
MKYTFHGKEYRAQLEVTDWRISPSKKAGEPDWLVRQKQNLSQDKVSVSVYILPQTMNPNTPFRGHTKSTQSVFYQTSNGKDFPEVFAQAWRQVKRWTELSDDDLPKKFHKYRML